MRALGLVVIVALAVACDSTAPPLGDVCRAGDAGPPPNEATCAAYDVVAVASDYASSATGAFSSTSGIGNMLGDVSLGQDPALALSAGRLFFVARDLDTVFELDPHCGTPIGQLSTADPSFSGTTNPQDVAVAPDGSLWIPRYDEPSLLVATCGGASQSIDLAQYDGDGNPQASSVRIVSVNGAPKAFVTLERLDDDDMLQSEQPSWMLVVDVATRTPETTVVLAGRNPFNLIVEADGVFWLAEPGNFDDATEPLAGIERFDPQTSTTQLLVHESALGGSVAEVAVSADGGCGAAIVADAEPTINKTSLVTFDPTSGKVLAPATAPVLGPTDNYDLQGLVWKGDTLLLGDRRAPSSGSAKYPVHAFDRSGACTLTERADVVFIPQKPVALRTAG